MKKKVLATLLAITMAMGALAGCGSEQVVDTGKTSESVKNTEKETEQVKVSEEVETVKWAIRSDAQEDDDLVLGEVNKLLKERYNLELKLIAIAPGEYEQKMQLMSTSGEDFDLCFTCDWTFNYFNNAAKGAFYPLNELLETEAAESLMSVFPEWSWEFATISDTIYAVPNNKHFAKRFCAVIQKDLADKYGLDYNTDYESIVELEWFLEKVRDNEEGIYPVAIRAGELVYGWPERNGFDFINQGIIYLDDPELNVTFSGDDEEGIFAIYEKCNDYYKRGFLRSDLATVTDVNGDLNNGKYAMVIQAYTAGVEQTAAIQRGEEYVSVFLGDDWILQRRGSTETMTGINVNSKNPEAAIKMLGVMWTDPEIYNMLVYGLEGVHYEKIDDIHVRLIEGSKYDRSWDPSMFGNQFNSYLLEGQPDNAHEIGKEANENAIKSPLAGFVFDSSAVSTELAQVNAVVKEFDKSYCWAEDYDQWLADFTDKLKKAEVYKVTEELQKQIDEFKANK